MTIHMDKEHINQLHRSEEKFQVLFENSPIGMAMISHQTGDFLEVNQSLLDSIGYSKEEFLSLSFWDITPPEYESQEAQQIEDLNNTGRFGPNEKEYIRKDGTRFPIRLSGFKMIDIDGQEVVWGLIQDISERKILEEELRFMATHDPLTNLANRRLFSERLEMSHDFCYREDKNFGILVLDIDKFKSINDCFGHIGGDEVLKTFSERLKMIVHRRTDTVARSGGDEFMILLSLVNCREDIQRMAERIMEAISKPFIVKDQSIQVTVSIGASMFPVDSTDVDELIKMADNACYKVKKIGGDGIAFCDDCKAL